MKFVPIIVVAILVFLAVSSGATKIMLMPQDTEFFGRYGFSDAVLMVFGAVQLVGGVMLIFAQTRALGAALVAVTFAVSAVLLALGGNIAVTIVTLIALVFLGLTLRQSLRAKT